MTLVTIVGRGHSGTRAISHTLYASGVYMGASLNRSGDLIPPEKLYEACRMIARHVEWKGDLTWDFSRLHTMDIPPDFTRLLRRYLRSVLAEQKREPAALIGWKIPETTLIYPWLVRLYPEIKFVFWIRDPRDCILAQHGTDDLAEYDVSYPPTDDVRLRRAISWKYQFDIVKSTPRPQHWIEVRFEDFVTQQERTLARLEEFLGIPLARIIVRSDSVERWRHDDGTHDFDFFEPAMREYGYDRGRAPRAWWPRSRS